jgi:protein TonB
MQLIPKPLFILFMKSKFLALWVLSLFLTFSAVAQTTPAATTNNSPAVTDKVLPVAEHYEGGQAAMYAFIAKELVYPPLAKRNRIQGQCIVSFTLNEDGSTANHKVIKNIGGGAGEEALRVVKLLKFKAPGYSMATSLPINFKL